MNALKEYIYQKNIGDTVILTIKRNNRNFEITATLGKI